MVSVDVLELQVTEVTKGLGLIRVKCINNERHFWKYKVISSKDS
jgi:hypothetical protein